MAERGSWGDAEVIPRAGTETVGPRLRLLCARSEEQWVSWAADEFVAAALQSVRANGAFHVVLPGGGTPRSVLGRVSAEYGPDPALQEVWRSTHVYFGDERGVGPEHADSNYRMVREAWLDRVPVPAEQVHRIRGESPLEDAATDYADLVASRLGDDLRGSEGRGFDLVVLGLGEDGHTASLIPGVSLDFVARGWAGVGPAPLSPAQVRRVTLTAAALKRTVRCTFWAKGAAKARVVHAAVTGWGMKTIVPEILPESGEVTWILDAAAAAGFAATTGTGRLSEEG